ncbi:MAG: hypothetical protein AB1505_18165 [Candidatus Latescibacterota bacterium]
MTPELPSIGLPTRFLARFLLGAMLLSLVWELTSAAYLASLLPLANLALEWTAPGAHIAARGDQLLLAYPLPGQLPGLGELRGHELLHLNAAAAAAALLAVPGLPFVRRVAWTAGAVLAFWVTQSLALYAGARLALGALLGTAPRSGALAGLFGAWNTWGGMALAVALLIGALARDLPPGRARGEEVSR